MSKKTELVNCPDCSGTGSTDPQNATGGIALNNDCERCNGKGLVPKQVNNDIDYIDNLFKICADEKARTTHGEILLEGVADIKARLVGYKCAMAVIGRNKRQMRTFDRLYKDEIKRLTE